MRTEQYTELMKDVLKEECRLLYNPILDVIYYADIDNRYEGCGRLLEDGWYLVIMTEDFEVTTETFTLADNRSATWNYTEFECNACLLSREEQRSAFLSSLNFKPKRIDDGYGDILGPRHETMMSHGRMYLTKKTIESLLKKKIDTVEDFFNRQKIKLKKEVTNGE